MSLESNCHYTACADCGAIVPQHHAGRTRCESCAELYRARVELVERAYEQFDLRTPEAIAKYAGLPLDIVRDIVNDSPILSESVVAPWCMRCDERPAEPGAKLCMSCRMALERMEEVLDDAAHSEGNDPLLTPSARAQAKPNPPPAHEPPRSNGPPKTHLS